jgi:hypothetical protein
MTRAGVLGRAACALALLAAGAAFARDLHVSPGAAADGADGSAARPFPAVAAALAAGAGQGDRLLLAPGDHGAVVIGGVRADPPLEVLAAPGGRPPRLSSLRVRDSDGVSVEGLLVEGGDGGEHDALVTVDPDAARVRISGLTIRSGTGHEAWTEDEWRARARSGIAVRGAGAEILGNQLSAVRFGITVFDSSPGARVADNVIDGFSGDGLRGLGDGGLYERNIVKNCVQVDGNHADGFQSWSLGPDGAPGTGVVRGVVLRGNTILQTSGRPGPLSCVLQGIGLFDGMYEDWLIEDNLVEVDAWHGITVAGGINVRILGNTVRNLSPAPPGPPWITIGAHKDGRPGAGNLIAGNRATAWLQGGGGSATDPRVTVMRDNLRLAPVR